MYNKNGKNYFVSMLFKKIFNFLNGFRPVLEQIVDLM